MQKSRYEESRARVRIVWTCSDFVNHQHRFKFTAWLCGRYQAIRDNFKVSTGARLAIQSPTFFRGHSPEKVYLWAWQKMPKGYRWF